MDKIKKIAVLTSGGDAPAMNAAIRAVVRTALSKNIEVIGVRRGYNGLLRKDLSKDKVLMKMRSVSDIIHRGGTILYTARSAKFKTEEGIDLCAENCRKLGIDGVVAIGGDGTFRGARDLSSRGIRCVGIPATIDNDISCSEYTIGFDTAMNTAMKMVDCLRDTAQSHDRCSVVEVMGRRSGELALHTGIAVGATSIIVPEIKPYNLDPVIKKIRDTKKGGKKHFIIIVAEGVQYMDGGQTVEVIAERIKKETGIDTRSTVLGHVQRGGSPTSRDREMASRLGFHAVELLLSLDLAEGGRVVALKNNKIVDFPIDTALEMTKPFDIELYNLANDISI